MLRTILIGLDGTPASEAVVALGLRWAKAADAMLVGLGVIDEPGIRTPVAVPLGGSAFKERRDEAVVATARRQVEQALEQFALRCAEAGVSCKLLQNAGTPSEQIALEAQRYDLIMLGQRTSFRFGSEAGWDQTLQNVVRASPRPVVTAPAALGEGEAAIVAYDGSLQAARTLHAFVASGLAAARSLHVVSIDDDRLEAAKRSQRAVDYLQFHGLPSQRLALAPARSVAEVLLEQAAALDAGLLVMGAYGQPTLKEFLFGSVTRTLIERSNVPLFLFH